MVNNTSNDSIKYRIEQLEKLKIQKPHLEFAINCVICEIRNTK